MKSITFFSYKGGSGRTLTATNFAVFSALTGQRVVLIDFDLDAPGVDFKLRDGKHAGPRRGVLDYLLALQEEQRPGSIQDYVYPVSLQETTGALLVMPAGDYPSHGYVEALRDLNWQKLFKDPEYGIALFQDLLVRMEKELGADLVVIDSRSGISEISGVCTEQLGDDVVILTTAARESLHITKDLLRHLASSELARALEKAKRRYVICSRLPRPAAGKEWAHARHWAERLEIDLTSVSFLYASDTLAAEEFTALEEPFRDPGLTWEYLMFFSKIDDRRDVVEDFRARFLRRTLAEIVEHKAPEFEPRLKIDLLSLVAALQPLCPEDEDFLNLASMDMDAEPARIRRHLEGLAVAGVLRATGNTGRTQLEIVPTPLADLLLEQACLTSAPEGRPFTDFALRRFETWGRSIWGGNLLRNMARLARRQQQAGAPDPMVEVWPRLEEEYRALSNLQRAALLGRLESAAMLQPMAVLRFCEVARRSPPLDPQPVEHGLPPLPDEAAMHRLPMLLRAVAIAAPQLARAFDLLWEMGRDGRRDAGHSDEAMETLRWLARYERYKPATIQAGVVEAVERWIREPGAHDHTWHPLDALVPVLLRGFRYSEVDGSHLVMTVATLRRERLIPLRERALLAVKDVALGESAPGRRRAVEILLDVLRVDLSDERQAEEWLPERLAVLAILGETSRKSTEPAAVLQIARGLRGVERRDPDPKVRQQAAEILGEVPTSFIFRLTSFLGGGIEQVGGYPDQSVAEALIEEFLKIWPEPDIAFIALDQRLRAVRAHGLNLGMSLYTLAEVIARREPRFVLRFAELVAATPDSVVADSFAPFLGHLRRIDGDRFHALAAQVLDQGPVQLGGAIAEWFTRNDSWARERREAEIQLLLTMAESENRDVRRSVLSAARILAPHAPTIAIRLCSQVEIGAEPELAEALSEVFSPVGGQLPMGMAVDAVAIEQLSPIVQKLVPIRSLEGHAVGRFLDTLLEKAPDSLVEMLLQRARRAGPLDAFYLLPHAGLTWRHDHPFVDSEAQARILRRLRDALLNCSEAEHAGITSLLGAFAVHIPILLDLLREWIDSGEEAKIVAAVTCVERFLFSRDALRIHGGGGVRFLLEETSWVADVLVHAESAGSSCLAQVEMHLLGLFSNRSGAVEELIREELELRDKADALARAVAPGSAVQRFYQKLVASAEDWIAFHTRR